MKPDWRQTQRFSAGSGWARNLDDGRVELYAIGSDQQLSELAAALHLGPRMAEVRSVEERDAPVESVSDLECADVKHVVLLGAHNIRI